MKKLILFSLMVALLATCQSPVDESLTGDPILKNAKKVTVCHRDQGKQEMVTIDVSINALPAHLAHGDKLAFSPQGSYVVHSAMNGFIHDWVITTFDGVNFTGVGGFPAGSEDGYSIHETLTGTVIDGVLSMTMSFVETEKPWSITGVVDQCGGIVSLDGLYTISRK